MPAEDCTMGINANGLRFLLYAKSCGVDFTRTATIGRLGLHLSLRQFSRIIRDEFRHALDPDALKTMYDEKYCDRLLEYLGAAEVHSFDYSDYQAATYIHDFNTPIPDKYFGQYTAVIEGGTLEHVFNFPVAIKNCMQMIRVGGHYLSSTPTNNYMGHGFYQFSPELFFRIFSEENGFCTEQMIMHEGKESKRWYAVPDPRSVNHRVGMRNASQTLLLVLAKRISDVEIFSTLPLQSGYVSQWDGKKKAAVKRRGLRNILHRIRSVFGRGHIPPFFTPFDPFK